MNLLLWTMFLGFIGIAYADTKFWNKNINFYNEDNWDKRRQPCPLDKVLIPEQSTSIYLQTNGTLKEIVFPMQGEIILASNLKISFSDDPKVDPSCSGEDITFSRSSSEPWLNPDNWESDQLVPIESDKIPCEFDNVVFPSNKQFYVGLDEVAMISSLTVDGQRLLSSSVDGVLSMSSRGQLQFDVSNHAHLRLTGGPCGDQTGCECEKNIEQILDKICHFISVCPAVTCQNAIKPVGACCNLCGGFLTLDYDAQLFNFEQMKGKLIQDYNLASGGSKRVRRQTDQPVVSMYMSKTKGKIQVILTDDVAGADNGKEASKVARQINADITGNPSAFGIVDSHGLYSGGTEKQVGPIGTGATAGIITALVIGIMLVVSIIFVMFRKQPFLFKRDEPLDADIEMPNMNKNYIEELHPEVQAVAFDNPMYDKPLENLYSEDPTKESNGSMEDVEDVGAVGDLDDGFYNPMAITAQ